MHGRPEESTSYSITLLLNELLIKIWLEHLQSHDRFSFASISKNFLCLFKSINNSTSQYDLQQQLARVGLEEFPVIKLAGIDKKVIDRLTAEFTEDFRSIKNKRAHCIWLLSPENIAIRNPHFWQLALALVLLDMQLPALPPDYCQFSLTEKDLPYCFELIRVAEKSDWSDDNTIVVLQRFIDDMPKEEDNKSGYSLHVLLSNALATLIEVKVQSSQTPSDKRELKFPENFSPQIRSHIANRYTTSNKIADIIVTQLSRFSPEHLARINQFLYQEWYSDAFRGFEKWNEYIVAFARYMRISLPLDNLLQHLTQQHHKQQIHAFYMSRFKNGEFSRLHQQLLVDHLFPLMQQLRSTYPTLDDEIYLTAYVYCAHNTPFSIKIDLLRQFVAEMWQLKNNYPELFAYIKRKFSLNFTLGLTIGFGQSKEYIELITPYLTRGIAQPVLTKHLAILDNLTQYGYHFARAASHMTRFMNCLSEIKSAHPGLLLFEDDLDNIFGLIQRVYQDKDVAKQLVAEKAPTKPGLKA